MYYGNILNEKMNGVTECPNCSKDGLTVPMSEDENGFVCSLCGATA